MRGTGMRMNDAKRAPNCVKPCGAAAAFIRKGADSVWNNPVPMTFLRPRIITPSLEDRTSAHRSNLLRCLEDDRQVSNSASWFGASGFSINFRLREVRKYYSEFLVHTIRLFGSGESIWPRT